MAYSTESDVYEATGQNTTIVQKLSGGKTAEEISAMIGRFIERADRTIKNDLRIPTPVRKEYHCFHDNDTVQLGPEEDTFGFYAAYDPKDCVEAVYAIYNNVGRVKLPYPKNCDDFTESHTGMTAGANCTLSTEATIVKCGVGSIKAVFSDAGSFSFPSGQNLMKNIEPWDYIGFWAYTLDKTATFTIKIFDADGNFISKTFTLSHNNTWELIQLELVDFTNYSLYEFDNDRHMQYIQIESDADTTLYFDNFNFNDGFFWTYPEGLICWSMPDTDVGDLEIYVTYAFDPYKVDTPEEITLASAKKAGILLLEYLIGCRQRITAFTQTSDALENLPDRETLEFRRAELQRQVEGILAGIGFKTYEGFSE